MIGETVAVFTGWGACLRRDLDAGTRVGEITAQVDSLAKGIGRAEGQAVRQSLLHAGLSGVVVADAVALHNIDRTVALIGTAKINGSRCSRDPRHDDRPVVNSLRQ